MLYDPAVTSPASAPTVTVVTPNVASAAGGTIITITGTNLTAASAVSVAGIAVTSFTVNSPTQITATVAAYSTLNGTSTKQAVAVTTSGGTGSLTNFFFYPANGYFGAWYRGDVGGLLTDLTNEGNTLTANGSSTTTLNGLGAVSFNGTSDYLNSAGAVVSSAQPCTLIVVSRPTLLPTGSSIASPASLAGSSQTDIFYSGIGFGSKPFASDAVTNNIFAATGTSPGVTTSLAAVNNNDSTGDLYFDNVVTSGAFLPLSTNALIVGSQDGSERFLNGIVGEVLVYGYALSSAELTTIYQIHQQVWAVGMSITPRVSSAAGGWAATITGVGFTGTTSLSIGGQTVSSFTVASDTEITLTTPAWTTTNGTSTGQDILVTTPSGTQLIGGAFYFLPSNTAILMCHSADVGVTFSTAPAVTGWADLSGNGNNWGLGAGGSGGSTFGTLNGTSTLALTFDGTSQYLENTTAAPSAVAMFQAVRTIASDGNPAHITLDFGPATPGSQGYIGWGAASGAAYECGNGAVGITLGSEDGLPHALGGMVLPTSNTVYVDGFSNSQSATTTISGATNFLGSYSPSTFFSNSEIAFSVAYDCSSGAMGGGDISTVMAIIKAVYATP